jgi:AraC-like DNA-binding protein
MLALTAAYVPYIHCCGDAPRAHPWSKPQRRLAHYLLVTSLEGEEQIVVDEQRYQIGAGVSYLIQPGQLSDLWSVRGSRPVWVHFDVIFDAQREHHPHVVGGEPELNDRVRFLQPQAREVWGVDLPVIIPAPLQSLFRKRTFELVRTWHQRTPLCTLRAQQSLADLLLRLVEHVASASSLEPESLEGRLLAAENVARQSLDAPFGVDDFAAAAGLSRSRFTAVYQAQRGMSPGAFLRRERMQLATELLARTRLSMNEIGARVGYPDVTAFGRAFRALHGTTPTAWRKQALPETTRDFAHLVARRRA